MEPELLFDHLSEHHERINYARAYEILFGRFARWEQRMAQEVVEVALRTNPRPIAGANIRLDALIVNKDSGRPSSKHFESKNYSEQQWFGSFGSWPLCGHDDSFFTNDRLRASPRPAPPTPEVVSPPLSPGDQVIHREF